MTPMTHTLQLEGLSEGWKGHLVVEAPLSTERMRVLTTSGVHKEDFNGGTSKKEKNAALFEKQLPMLLDVYEKNARKYIREVNIVGPEGAAIKTVDEFDRHYATEKCWMEVAVAYMEGYGPKKAKG